MREGAWEREKAVRAPPQAPHLSSGPGQLPWALGKPGQVLADEAPHLPRRAVLHERQRRVHQQGVKQLRQLQLLFAESGER